MPGRSRVNERWQQLEALFEAALELAPPARDAWLAAQDVDAELKREVAALVAADDSVPGGGLTKKFGDAISNAAEVPVAGQRIGRYRLKREIGSGGAGIVFLAERADGEFEQDVAIKVIRGVATGDAVRQLRHERQVLAGFQHPDIARLFDGGETDCGQPYLVMEYIEGGQPITDACQKRGIELERRVALVREVALAVHYAHQRLVIHRDIKPANVLLRADGRPVLLDFGISKLLDANVTQALATQPWFTPAYAAPEQRRGAAVSTATDVYALGLLLYELVADQRPEVGMDGAMRPPSAAVPPSRRAAVRGDLDRIVAFATAYEPADRYPSADAVARDLERWLAGLPVRAGPDRAAYRLRKFVRRHPVGVAAAFAVAAMFAVFTWQLADERNRALAAERAAERQSQASQAVTDYLVNLFREAEPGGGRSRTLSPAELIDRGVARLETDTRVEPAARAQLLGTLGDIYQNMGLPVPGSRALAEAVKHARASGERRLLAQSLVVLARSLDERGKSDEAVRALAEAVSLYGLEGDEAGVAEARAHLGLTYAHVGDYPRAEAELVAARASAIRIEGEDGPLAIRTVTFLTEVLRDTGRDREALALLEAIKPRLEARLPPDDPTLLEFYGYYANLLLQLEDTDLAQQIFERVYARRSATLDPNSSSLGFVHNGLGTLYYQQGRTRDAAVQFALALAIGERTLDPDDPSLAIDLNNIASLYEEMGDYERGEPLLRRAVSIMARGAEERALYAQYRQNLGRLLMFAGKAAESRALLEAAIEGSVGENWSLQRARQSFHLAEWHRRYGEPDEAERYLDAAEAQIEALGGYQSARYGQLLRTRALLARARGETALAKTDLERARAVLAAARGELYVGVGEIDLELAEIALAQRDRDAARALVERARPVLEAVVVEPSPQRARLADLAARSGAAQS